MNGRLIFAIFLFITLLCTLEKPFSPNSKGLGLGSGHGYKPARADSTRLHTLTTTTPILTRSDPTDPRVEPDATCTKPTPVKNPQMRLPRSFQEFLEGIKGVLNKLLWQFLLRILPTPRASTPTPAQTKLGPTGTACPKPVKLERWTIPLQETIDWIKGALNDLLWVSVLFLLPIPPASASTAPVHSGLLPALAQAQIPSHPAEPAPVSQATDPRPVPVQSERLSRSFQETLEEYQTTTSLLENIKVLKENVMPLSWTAIIWVLLSYVASLGPIVGGTSYLMAKLLRDRYPRGAEIADAIDNLAIYIGRVANIIVNLAIHFGRRA